MKIFDTLPHYIIKKWLRTLHEKIITQKIKPKLEDNSIILNLGQLHTNPYYELSLTYIENDLFVLMVSKYSAIVGKNTARTDQVTYINIDNTAYPITKIFYKTVTAYIQCINIPIKDDSANELKKIHLMMMDTTHYA